MEVDVRAPHEGHVGRTGRGEDGVHVAPGGHEAGRRVAMDTGDPVVPRAVHLVVEAQEDGPAVGRQPGRPRPDVAVVGARRDGGVGVHRGAPRIVGHPGDHRGRAVRLRLVEPGPVEGAVRSAPVDVPHDVVGPPPEAGLEPVEGAHRAGEVRLDHAPTALVPARGGGPGRSTGRPARSGGGACTGRAGGGDRGPHLLRRHRGRHGAGRRGPGCGGQGRGHRRQERRWAGRVRRRRGGDGRAGLGQGAPVGPGQHPAGDERYQHGRRRHT